MLANPSWLQVYPHTQVTHLPKLYSDDYSILVDLMLNSPRFTHPFHGLVAWTKHEPFVRFFQSRWHPSHSLIQNINIFRAKAPLWHRLVFGNISAKKHIINIRLMGIHQTLENRHTPFLDNLQSDLSSMYDKLSTMEKSIWTQCARISNYKDLNTQYFHVLVKIRQAKCNITMLKDHNGQGVKGHCALQI